MTAPTPTGIILGNTAPGPTMEPWQAEILAYADSLPALRPDPPIVRGRYDLPDPVTNKPAKWTRSSGFAKTLDDSYNIERWTQRKVMEGLLAHPNLAAQIAAIGDRESKEGKDAIHELMDRAAWLAGRSLGADLGTAFHTIAEHADAGHPIADGAWTPALVAYQDAFARAGMSVIREAIELVVVNTALGVAGRGDRFVMLEGRPHPLIADIKTGSTLNEVACAIQLAAYARSSHIWTPEGYREMPPVDLDLGIIMHVDLEAGTCVMHALNISDEVDEDGNAVGGWARCQVALAARKARNGGKKLLVPLTPATPITANDAGPVAVVTAMADDASDPHLFQDTLGPNHPAGPSGDCKCGESEHHPVHAAVKNAGASSTVAAPGQGEVADEVTQPPETTSPENTPPTRSEWLMGRFRELAGEQRARDWLATHWPDGVPTAPPWTDDHVDTLAPILADLETAFEAPFPPLDPAAPTPSEKLRAAHPDVPDEDLPIVMRPVDDDGTPLTDVTIAAVKAATATWDQARKDHAAGWGHEAKLAQRPFNGNPDRSPMTERQGAILLAASACISHLWDDDEPNTLTRHALAMTLGEDLQPGSSTGGVLGSLTTTQAQRLRQIAEAFTSASPNADAEELGTRYLAATTAA